MTDLGEVYHILGLRILKKDGQISVDQSYYIEKILKRYQMDKYNAVNTPIDTSIKLTTLREHEKIVNAEEYRSIVGALNYATMLTRPDIATAVGIVARYMQKPGRLHWLALKRIMKYLKGTVDYGLVFYQGDIANDKITIEAYCDADWAGNLDDRKSTSGYVIKLGDTAIS